MNPYIMIPEPHIEKEQAAAVEYALPANVLAMLAIYILGAAFLAILSGMDTEAKALALKKHGKVTGLKEIIRVQLTRTNDRTQLHWNVAEMGRKVLYIIKRADNEQDFRVIGAGVVPAWAEGISAGLLFNDTSLGPANQCRYKVTMVDEDGSWKTSLLVPITAVSSNYDHDQVNITLN